MHTPASCLPSHTLCALLPSAFDSVPYRLSCRPSFPSYKANGKVSNLTPEREIALSAYLPARREIEELKQELEADRAMSQGE